MASSEAVEGEEMSKGDAKEGGRKRRTGLDLDTEAPLGGGLWEELVSTEEGGTGEKTESTNLDVVDLTSEENGEGRAQSLLKEHRNLTGRVELTAVSRHAEVVLDTGRRNRLTLARVHGGHADEVDTGIDAGRQLLPVRRLPNPLAHELGGSNPRVLEWRTHLVLLDVVPLRHVTNRAVLHLRCRALVHSLDSDGEVGSDGLEVGGDVGAGEIGGGGVVGLEGEGVVLSDAVVLDGEHRRRGGGSGELHRELGRVPSGPSVVHTAVDRTLVVDHSLEESLREKKTVNDVVLSTRKRLRSVLTLEVA
jgi:hypothetical protein